MSCGYWRGGGHSLAAPLNFCWHAWIWRAGLALHGLSFLSGLLLLHFGSSCRRVCAVYICELALARSNRSAAVGANSEVFMQLAIVHVPITGQLNSLLLALLGLYVYAWLLRGRIRGRRRIIGGVIAFGVGWAFGWPEWEPIMPILFGRSQVLEPSNIPDTVLIVTSLRAMLLVLGVALFHFGLRAVCASARLTADAVAPWCPMPGCSGRLTYSANKCSQCGCCVKIRKLFTTRICKD